MSWGFLGRLESDGVQAVGEAASLGRCERRSLGSWETKASAARRDRGIDQLRCDNHMQMVITMMLMIRMMIMILILTIIPLPLKLK